MSLASQNIQIVCNGLDTQSGKKIRNIFFYRGTTWTAPNADTQASIAAAFQTWWDATIMPLLSIQYQIESIQVRNLDDPTDLGETIGDGTFGSITGDALPADNAVVLHWTTGLRGKEFRGKTHFGLIGESDTTTNQLNAGAITAWKAAGASFVALTLTGTIGLNVYAPAVFRPTATAGNFTPGGIKYTLTTGYLLNKMIGSMNRRKQRGVYA